MLKFLPLLLGLAYGLLLWRFSAWRTRADLDARSAELADRRLGAVLARLAAVLEVPRIPVRIYEIAPVNGLAAPDGRIFLTRGFYDRYLTGTVSAEELATVVAHELGHVAMGHARRRMIDFTGQNAVRFALMGLVRRVLPGIGPWLVNLAMTAVAARLSRRDEFEADAYAAALLTKSGIGTAPQKALLAKLGALTGSAGVAPAWLMSHPAVDRRIAAIEALEARWAS
jgi:Zn-dependent protease with chaperone function